MKTCKNEFCLMIFKICNRKTLCHKTYIHFQLSKLEIVINVLIIYISICILIGYSNIIKQLLCMLMVDCIRTWI